MQSNKNKGLRGLVLYGFFCADVRSAGTCSTRFPSTATRHVATYVKKWHFEYLRFKQNKPDA